MKECFNSPYGHVHFPVYAEEIGFTPGTTFNVEESSSESVKMLSSVAKETGVWLLGGVFLVVTCHGFTHELCAVGSIPEKDPADGKLYNTATVWSPEGEPTTTSYDFLS